MLALDSRSGDVCTKRLLALFSRSNDICIKRLLVSWYTVDLMIF